MRGTACFYGYPLRGHTVPSLTIVAELVRRGIRVDYHSAPAFRAMVEDAGAHFIAYPPECTDPLTEPVDSAEHVARTLAATERLLPLLLTTELATPDLVLFDASALWGGIVARRLRRRCVASVTTYAMSRTLLQMIGAPAPAAWSDPIRSRLNDQYDARLHHHLDVFVPHADLKLVHTSRGFQPAERSFDASHVFVGPHIDARPRHGDRIAAAGNRPLAYVSLGTIFNTDHALLRMMSGALAASGWQVIVSLGNSHAPQPRSWPEHVQVHAFVDQLAVLAQAQLFVTHGGMNSVSESLAHGVPMIVIPQAVDQHLVARRAANVGAAIVIEAGDVSPARLSAAIEQYQRQRTSLEQGAARMQRSFSDVTPLADAVNRMLALIDTGSTCD